MKRVFVGGLYSTTSEKNNLMGCLDNIKWGITVCAKLVSMGFAPFCPWLDFLYFLIGDSHITENEIREYTMSFLETCDVMYVISNADNSGVNAEIKRARELSIPIMYSMRELDRWRYDNENR